MNCAQPSNFSLVGLYLYDEKNNRVLNPVLETVRGPGFAIPENFPVEDTITWNIYRHGQPVVIASRDRETRFPRMMEVYRTYGVQSACLLPLATAHRRLGTLLFAVEEENAYSEDEVRYLSLVADHVALALDNALRDEEQWGAETELRNQKAHLEQLFELAPEAIVLRDMENRILRVNREFSTLFGYTPEEAIGRSIIDLIVPDDRRVESEQMRAGLRRGERINAELIRRRKDGTLLERFPGGRARLRGRGNDGHLRHLSRHQRTQAGGGGLAPQRIVPGGRTTAEPHRQLGAQCGDRRGLSQPGEHPHLRP
ncbi:MAG: PAS domain S-box protein [Paludibaculum sp.]